jgi:small subunit ribosomal protein S9
MPTAKKVTKKEEAAPKSSDSQGKYIQGIGRRKRSVARTKLYVVSAKKSEEAETEILVNGKSFKDYFPLQELREIVLSPIKAVSNEKVGKIVISVHGGGMRGQAESARLGISRALVGSSEDNKKTLKDMGYLTRDARKVERKKAGLKKARRAPQFSKR